MVLFDLRFDSIIEYVTVASREHKREINRVQRENHYRSLWYQIYEVDLKNSKLKIRLPNVKVTLFGVHVASGRFKLFQISFYSSTHRDLLFRVITPDLRYPSSSGHRTYPSANQVSIPPENTKNMWRHAPRFSTISGSLHINLNYWEFDARPRAILANIVTAQTQPLLINV